MNNTGSAVWKGGLKEGQGAISTESGALTDSPYSFGTRFEDQKGTNPEELIGAAHAGCFTMALAAQLEQVGLKAEHLNTQATVTLEKSSDGFSITAIHLEVSAKIPGADRQAFDNAAQNAKQGCPVSKLFKANITMDATLES